MSLADQTLPSDGSVDRLMSTSPPLLRQFLSLHFHLTLADAPLKQQSDQQSVALFPPLVPQQQALIRR